MANDSLAKGTPFDIGGLTAYQAGSVVSRTIDTHIAELRRKLEPNPASPRHITTVWKTGYRFLP